MNGGPVMFDLHPDVEPYLADPSIDQAFLDATTPLASTPGAADRTAERVVRVRAAIGRRLIAAGAALLADEPVRRPVARS